MTGFAALPLQSLRYFSTYCCWRGGAHERCACLAPAATYAYLIAIVVVAKKILGEELLVNEAVHELAAQQACSPPEAAKHTHLEQA